MPRIVDRQGARNGEGSRPCVSEERDDFAHLWCCPSSLWHGGIIPRVRRGNRPFVRGKGIIPRLKSRCPSFLLEQPTAGQFSGVKDPRSHASTVSARRWPLDQRSKSGVVNASPSVGNWSNLAIDTLGSASSMGLRYGPGAMSNEVRQTPLALPRVDLGVCAVGRV